MAASWQKMASLSDTPVFCHYKATTRLPNISARTISSQKRLVQAKAATNYRADDPLKGLRTAVLFNSFFIFEETEKAAVR